VAKSTALGCACRYFNARNRFGGYDSPKPFLFDPAIHAGAIISGGGRVTDDLYSSITQLKGYEDCCGTSN
jgi:hypothetical protein